jgi:parallel beta-helix repeat protein
MTGSSLRPLSYLALLLAAAPLHAETHKVPSQHATIQEAVNIAVAGDIVSVAKGVYTENVVITTEGITLKGSSATINGDFTGNCITITANDVTVQSMILVNGGGIAPEPSDGGPPPATGGVLATGDGITLSKLTVNSCEDFGISLAGTGGTVDGCKVDACLVRGIDVSTGDEKDTASATLTVINKNTVTRCENGIRLEKGPFTVTSNTVNDNSDEGIEVNLGLAEVVGTTVSKNKVTGNLGTGLIVNQPDEPAVNVVVEKNTMDENGTGMLLEGFNIDATSNTITDSVTSGLVIEAELVNAEKNSVKNSGAFGILLIGFNNTLTKNTVLNSGSDGIFVAGNTETLDGNTVKDGEGDGIQVLTGVSAIVLANNTVSGNEHDGIDNSGTSTIINGNSSKANGGADIAGAGDGSGTVIGGSSTDNKVSDDSLGDDGTDFTTVGELDMPLP